MKVRVRLPFIGRLIKAISFVRNPIGFIARRLFRISLSFGIFGLSFGRGGIKFAIRIWPFSFIFGGGRRKKGKGDSRGSGGSGGEGLRGEKSGDGGSQAGGGGEKNDGHGGDSRRNHGDTTESRGERLIRALDRGIAKLREVRERSRERERQEREAREKREREIREKAASEARERQEREVREKAESEARERQEREARDKAKRDNRERAEREARNKAKRDTRERAESEARDKREREIREKAESEGREKTEREACESGHPIGGQSFLDDSPYSSASTRAFSLESPLPLRERVLLEASAGTGKTFALTSLVARFVAEQDLGIDQLLMVTFTKAAAAEMRERTRAKLAQALQALVSSASRDEMGGDANWMWPIASCDPEERDRRIKRLRTAVNTIDAATITTIHGFFQQTLREVGLRSSNVVASEIVADDPTLGRQVLRDELVKVFAAGDQSLAAAIPEKSPADVESRVVEILQALDANISSVAAPDQDCDPIARRWSAFVADVKRMTRERRVSNGTLSFDDLVILMRELIDPANPLSAEIIGSLRSRYRLVLIDEFQDTDDTQWEIFSQVFSTEMIKGIGGDADPSRPFLAMVLVGDPKQAIYRFRGADISVYLDVSSQSDLKRYEMTTNFRSDRDLVTALNRLFGSRTGANGELIGFKFGSPHIEFVQVSAASKGTGSAISIPTDEGASKALQLRWLPTDDGLTVDVIRPLIAEDLANHVVRLLNDGTISEIKNGQTLERKVVPGDISILVRNHVDADPLVEALRGRGLPVMKSNIGSVTDSPAVEQLKLLLAALATPSDSRKVRAFALSWFINLPVDHLLMEQDIIELSEQCGEWASELLDRGIVGFFQLLRADSGVVTQLSNSVEAERRLTDLEHLVELLHRKIGPKSLSAAGVLRHLDEMAQGAVESDENLRRIESDAEAIQITTMHASKGLEFPIVLVPFPKAPQLRGPAVYSHGGRRYVDSAPDVPWELDGLTAEVRKGLTRREIDGDELRIMYVAFTRAKHQLVVWWAKSRGMDGSPLARLLFGDHENIEIATKVPDNETVRNKFNEIALRVGDELVEVRELSTGGSPAIPLTESLTETAGSGRVAVFPKTASGRPHVRRWSYSGIVAGLPDDHADSTRGGTDEFQQDEDAQPATSPQDATASYANDGLFPMPASAAFGTLVHELLEKVAYNSPSLHKDLLDEIDSRGLATVGKVNPNGLAMGLARVVETPLDPLFPGIRLADILRKDRIPEMDFHFSLPNAVDLVKIAHLAAAESKSLFADYFAKLAHRWSSNGVAQKKIAGLMTGSLDAVLRHTENGETRFAVVDFKSNKLSFQGNPLDIRAYGYDSMVRSMTLHHYPLQALIYCVALHRFLLTRLDDYEIDKHLVGAGYLFIRGMVGSDTPQVNGRRNGVFVWRPSSDTVLAVDSLLGGRS